MKPRTRNRLLLLAGFAVYFAAVWYLWNTPVVYPLKIFVVLLHEVSHAVAALSTGGRLEAIVLDPREGGACYCPGGSAFVTLSAGYLGSLGWGVLLLLAASSTRVANRLLVGAVGGIVLGLTAFYLRGGFGIAFGVLFGLALVGAARYLSEALNKTLLQVLGLTSALYVFLDLRSDIFQRPDLRSDATMLAELTGVPAVLWGLIWMMVAIVVVGWMIRRSWIRT